MRKSLPAEVERRRWSVKSCAKHEENHGHSQAAATVAILVLCDSKLRGAVIEHEKPAKALAALDFA